MKIDDSYDLNIPQSVKKVMEESHQIQQLQEITLVPCGYSGERIRMGLYDGRILKAINTALRHSRQNMLAVLSFDSLTLFYILNNRPLLESLSMDYCESDGFEWAFEK